MIVMLLIPQGVFTIETYLYHNAGTVMDFNYVDERKNLPSLNAVCGVLIGSSVLYFLIVMGMPFDWVLKSTGYFDTAAQSYLLARADDVEYPCDNEGDELAKQKEEEAMTAGQQAKPVTTKANNASEAETLLDVTKLSHIYPDGTHAVKDVTFKVYI